MDRTKSLYFVGSQRFNSAGGALDWPAETVVARFSSLGGIGYELVDPDGVTHVFDAASDEWNINQLKGWTAARGSSVAYFSLKP